MRKYFKHAKMQKMIQQTYMYFLTWFFWIIIFCHNWIQAFKIKRVTIKGKISCWIRRPTQFPKVTTQISVCGLFFPFSLKVKVLVILSCPTDSLWPHGLYPTRILYSWDSPVKNTGVGCHFHLWGSFPTWGSNPGLLYWGLVLHRLSHLERLYLMDMYCI